MRVTNIELAGYNVKAELSGRGTGADVVENRCCETAVQKALDASVGLVGMKRCAADNGGGVVDLDRWVQCHHHLRDRVVHRPAPYRHQLTRPIWSTRAVRLAPTLAVLVVFATACPASGNDESRSTTTTVVDQTTLLSNTETSSEPDPETSETTGPDDLSAEPGSESLDDPLFPGLGNGGYDVLHYQLELDTTGPELVGVATIEALATQNLSSLNLDLVAMTVDEVRIDGAPVEVARDGRELTLTPENPIAENAVVSIVVEYHGTPQPVPDASLPTDLGWLDEPWGSYVASEPLGGATWFPGNDHPQDKATFEITITVDAGEVAAGPGLLIEQTEGPGTTTFTWLMDDPMATYLASVVVGDFTITTSEVQSVNRETPIILRDVLPTERSDEILAVIEGRHAAMLTEFEMLFGPYPYDSYGVVGVPENLAYALENQTLSLFGVDSLASDSLFIEQIQAHELAHQWFGNHVSPATWDDIWLNEGFASWADLYWTGIVTGQDQFQRTAGTFANSGLGPLKDLRPDELFGTNVYIRGALTLEALRRTEGDEAFFELMRTWLATHGGGSASTDDFLEVVSMVMSADAVALTTSWIEDEQMPRLPGT